MRHTFSVPCLPFLLHPPRDASYLLISPPQIQSPLEEARKLSDALGNRVLLKREDLQPVFSFKLRGG